MVFDGSKVSLSTIAPLCVALRSRAVRLACLVAQRHRAWTDLHCASAAGLQDHRHVNCLLAVHPRCYCTELMNCCMRAQGMVSVLSALCAAKAGMSRLSLN